MAPLAGCYQHLSLSVVSCSFLSFSVITLVENISRAFHDSCVYSILAIMFPGAMSPKESTKTFIYLSHREHLRRVCSASSSFAHVPHLLTCTSLMRCKYSPKLPFPVCNWVRWQITLPCLRVIQSLMFGMRLRVHACSSTPGNSLMHIGPHQYSGKKNKSLYMFLFRKSGIIRRTTANIFLQLLLY